MLKLGVLNLTLKSPPEPNRSVTEPTFLEAVGAAWMGRGAGARGAGIGAGRLAWNLDPELKFDPETAEETVWETRGDMSATTWETILLDRGLEAELENTVVDKGAAGTTIGRAGAGAVVRLVPETAEDTVCEIRG